MHLVLFILVKDILHIVIILLRILLGKILHLFCLIIMIIRHIMMNTKSFVFSIGARTLITNLLDSTIFMEV